METKHIPFFVLLVIVFRLVCAAEEHDETVPREYQGFAKIDKFRGVIDDPDGYVNVRAAKSADAPVLARAKTGEPFSFERKSDDQWCKVTLASGKTGWMYATRIRLFFTKDDLPSGPNPDDDIDKQAHVHGVNYYETVQGAVRGDREALEKFFAVDEYADGAGAEEHYGVLGVVIHLIGDDHLAKFLSSQPLAYQMMVRKSLMSGDPTYPFKTFGYLSLHFPKTAKIFFRSEIVDWLSPDGRYAIRKVFSDKFNYPDSKVTRAELIEKATGKTVLNLTADDIGTGYDREGSVLWAPDSKLFAFLTNQMAGGEEQITVYQFSGESFAKVELPRGEVPTTEGDSELKGAVFAFEYPRLDTLRWTKPNVVSFQKVYSYKSNSTNASGLIQHFDRTYEVTMTIGENGKVTTEQKRITSP